MKEKNTNQALNTHVVSVCGVKVELQGRKKPTLMIIRGPTNYRRLITALSYNL